MHSPGHTKPLVALIAAYAIALQALLAGMTLGVRSGQAALLAAAPLCLTDPSHPDHAPLERMPCCFSAACCQAGAEPGALPETISLHPRRVERGVLFLSRGEKAGALALEGPQQPRAPPAA